MYGRRGGWEGRQLENTGEGDRQSKGGGGERVDNNGARDQQLAVQLDLCLDPRRYFSWSVERCPFLVDC